MVHLLPTLILPCPSDLGIGRVCAVFGLIYTLTDVLDIVVIHDVVVRAYAHGGSISVVLNGFVVP